MQSEKVPFATKEQSRAYIEDPPQPAPDWKPLKLRSRGSRVHKEVRQFAPVLPKEGEVQVLGIGIAPTPEEAEMVEVTGRGTEIPQLPRLLKGPLGQLINDNLGRYVEIKAKQYAHAVVVPWLLPRQRRYRPSKEEIAVGMPLIHELIEETRPRAIIAYGKPVFDQLVDFKISNDDAKGGWFSYKDTGIPVYLCNPLVTLITQPWTLDQLITDFRQVDMMLGSRIDLGDGIVDHREIRTEEQLRELVELWKREEHKLFSVDCEWAGTGHRDGELRSIQFCWKRGHAAYLNFFNENQERILCPLPNPGSIEAPAHPAWKTIGPGETYTDFALVGEILGEWLNRPDVRFIGHYTAADSPWMDKWLNIEVRGKFVFDTMFASQTVNEYAPGGLDYLALRHTRYGRYDLPLIKWKKEHPIGKDEGYGTIPDEILIPYACLHGGSRVVLGDGLSRRPIGELVAERYDGEVMALVDGRVKPCKVTNWKHSTNPGQRWYRVETSEVSAFKQQYKLGGPLFTPDHELVVWDGRTGKKDVKVKVEDIAKDCRRYKIRVPDCSGYITQGQYGLLRGLLMAGVVRDEEDDRFSFRGGDDGISVAFAEWVARALECGDFDLVRTDLPDGVVEFRTAEPFELVPELREKYRSGNRKPREGNRPRILGDTFGSLNDAALAAWLMCDGRYDGETITLQIYDTRIHPARHVLMGFSQRLNDKERWPYEAVAVLSDDRRSLTFTRFGYNKLGRELGDYIHRDSPLGIQLPWFHDKEVRAEYHSFRGSAYAQIISVEEEENERSTDRYCLTVPEAGNFLTDIGFVSNCLDVEVPLMAMPRIEAELDHQGLRTYYDSYINPCVTEIFHEFATEGLPVDMDVFELVRGFFNWAYRALYDDLMDFAAGQADEMLAKALGKPVDYVGMLAADRDEGRASEAREAILELARPLLVEAADEPAKKKQEVGPIGPTGDAGEVVQPKLTVEELMKREGWLETLIDHWMDVRSLNIRSNDQLRRWIFDVLGHTPVKSTKGGDSGIPQMVWEKIMELPAKLRKLAKPSTDKESLEIISERDDSGTLVRILAVSNVGNQCKGFLKEGDVDQDGEVVKENGLAKYISKATGCIHPNISLTETARVRSFSPNVLNLSAYHNDGVQAGLRRVIDRIGVPPEFSYIFGQPEELEGMDTAALVKKRMPTVRSVVAAPPGDCFVESDWRTAEVRGLAFISGDRKLIELVTGRDPAFAVCGGARVRLYYPADSGIAPEEMDPAFLMAVKKGDDWVKVSYADLDKNPDGSLVNPAYDLHWMLVERAFRKPYEVLDPKRDRGAGKVAGFSSVYGAVAATIERRIEAVTGEKPPEGLGQALLDAIEKRQPVATAFLDEVALMPKAGRELRAASGRVRHFPVHSSELRGMPWRVRNSYLRSMGNEARNFYMQESVAATQIRASLKLNRFYRSTGMQARAIIGLYDAILTRCPLEERFICREAHEVFMDRVNLWNYHDRWMSYPIDTDLCFRWSWGPTKAEAAWLHDESAFRMDPVLEKSLMDALQGIENRFYAALPGVREKMNKP